MLTTFAAGMMWHLCILVFLTFVGPRVALDLDYYWVWCFVVPPPHPPPQLYTLLCVRKIRNRLNLDRLTNFMFFLLLLLGTYLYNKYK